MGSNLNLQSSFSEKLKMGMHAHGTGIAASACEDSPGSERELCMANKANKHKSEVKTGARVLMTLSIPCLA